MLCLSYLDDSKSINLIRHRLKGRYSSLVVATVWSTDAPGAELVKYRLFQEEWEGVHTLVTVLVYF